MEAIWQIQPLTPNLLGADTPEGKYFIPLDNVAPNAPISASLWDSFETNDQRKVNWVKTVTSGVKSYRIPYKYQSGTSNSTIEQKEYVMVLRLAEQYLIRAEARARQGNITGAKSDLNTIRTRAGLSGTIETDFLSAIAKERRVELFTEWGDRWLNLKRTDKVNEVMSIETPIKGGGNWAAYKSLFPIPVNEFLYNPALKGHQNPGYTEQ